VAWIQKVKQRMPVVHLKDMVIAEPPHPRMGSQWMAEVGEGNLNWPAILSACAESGIEWYAVEQDICQRDPFESLAISYRNLVRMGLR
jgi:sugar phosphate isomerase/epimerase